MELTRLEGAKFSVAELLRAGYSISELREGNALRLTEARNREALQNLRVTLTALLDGGFTHQDLANAYSVFDLEGMGVGAGEMFTHYGLPIRDIVAARFGAAELQDLVANMTREQLKESFTLEDLKVLKYTIQQVLDLGYTMQELRSVKKRAGGWVWLEAEFKTQGHMAPWICQASAGAHVWDYYGYGSQCKVCRMKLEDGLEKRS